MVNCHNLKCRSVLTVLSFFPVFPHILKKMPINGIGDSKVPLDVCVCVSVPDLVTSSHLGKPPPPWMEGWEWKDGWMDGNYSSLSFTDELSGIRKTPRISELRQIIGLTLKSCNSQNCHGETDSSSSVLVPSENACLIGNGPSGSRHSYNIYSSAEGV